MAGKRPRAWVVLALALAVTAGAAIWLRGSGITSRRQPLPFEESVVRFARGYLIPRAIRTAANPVAASPDVLRAGMEHFADHCASCHANDGSGDVAMGRALFPRAPDMRVAPTQAMTDGELFYVIEHGIPMTGMPAWGNGTAAGEEASWALVRFIRHLPRLTPAELHEMDALNPRSPAEEKRAKDVNDFLSGKDKE